MVGKKLEVDTNIATGVPEPSPKTQDEKIPGWLKQWNKLTGEVEVEVYRKPTTTEKTNKEKALEKDESKRTEGEKKLLKKFRTDKLYIQKKIKIYNLTFLGKNFAHEKKYKQAPRKQVAGVSKKFAKVLQRAQISIYKKYIKQGGAANREDFSKWCGVRTQHIGYRVGKSNHNKGKALDIDAGFNPWVPTRHKGVCRGENHTAGNNGISQKFNKKIWKNAVQAYDNAMKFVYGVDEQADLEARRIGESTENVFDRFKKTSEAIHVYLTMLYEPIEFKEKNLNNDNIKNHNPISESEFIKKITRNWGDENCSFLGIKLKYPFFEEWAVDNQRKITQDYFNTLLDYEFKHPENIDVYFTGQTSKGLPVHPCLYDLVRIIYPQIIQDHENLRWAMVHGKITSKEEKAKKLSRLTRDPCWGFLNIRKEIVSILVKEMESEIKKPNYNYHRWGASDLSLQNGKDNGDIMHFDLGLTNIVK